MHDVHPYINGGHPHVHTLFFFTQSFIIWPKTHSQKLTSNLNDFNAWSWWIKSDRNQLKLFRSNGISPPRGLLVVAARASLVKVLRACKPLPASPVVPPLPPGRASLTPANFRPVEVPSHHLDDARHIYFFRQSFIIWPRRTLTINS